MYVTVLGLECAPNMYNLQVFLSALTKGVCWSHRQEERVESWEPSQWWCYNVQSSSVSKELAVMPGSQSPMCIRAHKN